MFLGEDDLCDFCPSEFDSHPTANFKKKENTERVQTKIDPKYNEIIKNLLRTYFHNKKKKLEAMKQNGLTNKQQQEENNLQNGGNTRKKKKHKKKHNKSIKNLDYSEDSDNFFKSDPKWGQDHKWNFIKNKKKINKIANNIFGTNSHSKVHKLKGKSKPLKNTKASSNEHLNGLFRVNDNAYSMLDEEDKTIENGLKGLKEEDSVNDNNKYLKSWNSDNSFADYKGDLTEYDDDKDSKTFDTTKGELCTKY